jgi:hypothetical protein
MITCFGGDPAWNPLAAGSTHRSAPRDRLAGLVPRMAARARTPPTATRAAQMPIPVWKACPEAIWIARGTVMPAREGATPSSVCPRACATATRAPGDSGRAPRCRSSSRLNCAEMTAPMGGDGKQAGDARDSVVDPGRDPGIGLVGAAKVRADRGRRHVDCRSVQPGDERSHDRREQTPAASGRAAGVSDAGIGWPQVVLIRPPSMT